MKKIFLTLALSLGLLAGCDFFVDPVAYNDKIVAVDEKAIDAYDAYDTLFSNTPVEGDLDALDKKREETITQITTFRAELAAMEGLKGDIGLRDAFLEDFDSMIKTLGTEEKELIELSKKMAAAPEVDEADITRQDELIDAINASRDAMYEKLSATQEAFATEHGYELEPETYQP